MYCIHYSSSKLFRQENATRSVFTSEIRRRPYYYTWFSAVAAAHRSLIYSPTLTTSFQPDWVSTDCFLGPNNSPLNFIHSVRKSIIRPTPLTFSVQSGSRHDITRVFHQPTKCHLTTMFHSKVDDWIEPLTFLALSGIRLVESTVVSAPQFSTTYTIFLSKKLYDL